MAAWFPDMFCNFPSVKIHSFDIKSAIEKTAMQKIYCSVYYITLNSNCEAQRAHKNLKKIVEYRARSQNERFECNFFLLFLKEKIVFKHH